MLDNEKGKELLETRAPETTTSKSSAIWRRPVLIAVGVIAVVIFTVLVLSNLPVREDSSAISEEEYVAEISEHFEDFLVSLYTLAYSMPTDITIAVEVVSRVEEPANKVLALNAPKAFKAGHQDLTEVVSIAKEFCALHLRAVAEMDPSLFEDADPDDGYNMGAYTNSGLTKMATSVEKDNPELAIKINLLLDRIIAITEIDPKNPTSEELLEAAMWAVDLSNKTKNIDSVLPYDATKEDIANFRTALSEVRRLTPPLTLASIYYNDYLPGILEYEKHADAMEAGNHNIALEHAENAIGIYSGKGVLFAVLTMFEHLGDITPTDD